MTAREKFVVDSDVTLMSAVDGITIGVTEHEEKMYGVGVASSVRCDLVGRMTIGVWKVRSEELNRTYWMSEEEQKVELDKALDLIREICDHYVALAKHEEKAS